MEGVHLANRLRVKAGLACEEGGMMSKSVGIGVIGMGWVGTVHSRCYAQVSERFRENGIQARLVICADEVEARAREGQQRFGFERWTTDWKELIDNSEVEAISIASPNYLHLEVVRAAAKKCKHIFCEKPVGMSPEQTAEIEEIARQANVITWVGYNYRWAPVVQYARKLIQEGKLGEVTHYRGRFLVDYGSDPNGVLSWRFKREFAGSGTLGDLMSHVVDMAHSMVGPVKRLTSNCKTFITQRPLATKGVGTHFSTGSAEGPKGEVTNEDYVSALVQFSNGAQGTFEVCRVIKGHGCEMAFELNGTKGALKWNFERMNELQLNLPDNTTERDGMMLIRSSPEHPSYVQFYTGPSFSMSYDDLKLIETVQFLTSVVSKKQGEPGFREALAVAEVQNAMQRSWRSGCWEEVSTLRQN